MDDHPKLISRQEATDLGLKRYFTGNPCKAGHISERWIKPDCCYECMRLRNLAYSRSHKDYFKAQSTQWRKDNPDDAKAIRQRYEKRHAEKVAKKNRLWALKQKERIRSLRPYRIDDTGIDPIA